MNMSIQSGGISHTTDLSGLLDTLKTKYPNLKTDDYNKIAEHNFKIEDEVEVYIKSWWGDIFEPDFSRALEASIRDPGSLTPEEQARIDEIDLDIASLVSDDLWAIPDLVPMPKEVRDRLIVELEKATGERYEDRHAVGGVSVASKSMSTGTVHMDDTSHLVSESNWNGKFDHAPDIDNILQMFKGDSLASGIFGFLGKHSLLGRNVQASSVSELAKIDEREKEIMAELAGLEKSGMRADDPRYHSAMTKVKQELEGLNSSKQELMAMMQKAQQSEHELITFFSTFIKQFIDMQQQVVNNMRVA